MANTQNNKINKNNKKYKKIRFVFFIIFLVFILYITDIYRCPFKYITGIPCPLCGITRALISALKLDFNKAFYYHALWPLILVVMMLYFLTYFKHIKINKKLENMIYITTAILLLVYYVLRHYFNSPIVSIHYYDSLIYHIYKFFIK